MTDSRKLDCTHCRARITVHEIPVQFLDPQRYVCGWCLTDKTPTLTEPLVEVKRYDPTTAEVPY
jgi:hypothetical protein